MPNVNLDALIPRLDMAAGEYKQTQSGPVYHLKHTELEFGSNTYQVLRKPDFQRETAAWTPEKVRDLVLAYATEMLVPAIILWRSPKNDLFVIDGSHRLSSLIAWMQNDYGDGDLSKIFFDDISDVQKAAAKRAKELVEAAVGPWKEIAKALHPDNVDSPYRDIAKVLNMCQLTVQPLLTQDVEQAERSFFKINEQGVPLTDTDKIILLSRNCPNSIAARAINQKGTGHAHWKKFGAAARARIEKLSVDLNLSLFTPAVTSVTVKTPDQPIAGRYSAATALSLLLHTVNQANRLEDFVPSSKDDAESFLAPDKTGVTTERFLKNAKNVVTRMSNRVDTDYMKSLDLHPFVYFYSDRGRHQPSAFLATVELIAGWQDKQRLFDFTLHRDAFESFLIQHKDFLQQIVRSTRGGLRAVHAIKKFFEFVLAKVALGSTDDEIVAALQSSSEFEFLKVSSVPTEEEVGVEFSVGTKSQVVVSEGLQKKPSGVRYAMLAFRIAD
jgi:hypothetical protein